MVQKVSDGAILAMICQYGRITNGGAVRPYMLAVWCNLSRQQASTRLKQLETDGLLKSEEYLYRPKMTAKRYIPTARTIELYEDGTLLSDYLAWVAMTKTGQFFAKMIG